MILYKYMKTEDGARFLRDPDPHILFSCLSNLNDPFEMATARSEGLGQASQSVFDRMKQDQSFLELFHVFCLTRTPFNPLMWAHYTGNYTGCVIGFDTEILGLHSQDAFIVPVEKGSVVYSATPIKAPPEDVCKDICSLTKYDSKFNDYFQWAFLNKGMPWSYEEEVRVVAHKDQLSGIERSKDLCFERSKSQSMLSKLRRSPKNIGVIRKSAPKHLGHLIPIDRNAIREFYYWIANDNLSLSFLAHQAKYDSLLPHLDIIGVRCDLNDYRVKPYGSAEPRKTS